MKQLLAVAIALVLIAVAAVAFLTLKPADSKELTLHCGAGIRPAAKALIEAFEATHDVKISGNYAGSGTLLGQITALQKGDLFMPGAELYVDKAIEKGLAVKDTKRVVAYFIPVIFVQKGNPRGVASLQDLKKEGLRVGLGDERACAIGKKTLKIFEKNGIPYADIQKNVANKSGTVTELGMWIQLKNVDATILWDANARHFAKDGDVVEIPVEQNIPSTIPIVLLECSAYPEEARDFIEFATSNEGRKLLTDRGYTVTLP